LQVRLKRESASREILGVISRSRDNETPVFDTILQHACRLCGAQLAFMMQVDADGYMVCPAQRGANPEFAVSLANYRNEMESSPLAGAVAIREMRAIRNDDISDDDLYRSGEPNRVSMVEVEGVRSLLVVPMISKNRGIGSILLYRREIDPFSDEDAALIESFAAQAVVAIENVQQFMALESLNAELGDRVEEQVAEIERMGKLKRFLPAAVADTVVSSGSEELLKSHRSLLGVLFCDMRGFTAFCESAEPEETIEVLQTYHEEMGKLISEHGAGVDHRMGDGIMVLFNDPLPCDDPAGNAVRLAIAMRERMTELSKKWKKLGHRLGFGVGVSLGYATVGMVGYEGRSDYTASGTAVNLAARLCDLAADGEILLSPRAFMAIEDDHSGELTGEVSLKGIREPVEVYRLLDTES
jgi:class 3 adenylate cyclase